MPFYKYFLLNLLLQACHFFSPNSSFNRFEHPRFGKIMAIFAKEDIEKDDEIFVSYGNGVAGAQEWCRNLWLQYLR